jgi:hypothetical protein
MEFIVHFEIPANTEDEAQAIIDNVHGLFNRSDINSWYEKTLKRMTNE